MIDACITHKKKRRRRRRSPVVSCIQQERFELRRVLHSIIEFVINVIDINNDGPNAIHRVAMGSELVGLAAEILVRDNNVVCTRA